MNRTIIVPILIFLGSAAALADNSTEIPASASQTIQPSSAAIGSLGEFLSDQRPSSLKNSERQIKTLPEAALSKKTAAHKPLTQTEAPKIKARPVIEDPSFGF